VTGARNPSDAARLRKLERINAVLMDRIERLEASKGSARSMFQAAVALEKEVNARTRDLERALEDLSQRNRELAIARAAAEEANRSKTRFLRAASHDLLQPIAAAKLFLGVLEDSGLDPAQREIAERLTSAFQSVEELMQAVLEISRLDSQRNELNRQPVFLSALFERLGREHGPQAAAKGLKLIFGRTQRAVVDSDPTYLRRIAQNLISNAIKYTRQGGVIVRVRRQDAYYWLEVRDSGVGIAPEDRRRIFEEFQRVEGETGEAGMGLGLAIVRRACAKLGHPIQLESEPGRGSTFRIGLPPATLGGDEEDEAAAGRAAADPGRDGLRGAVAILVENDPALQRAYAMLLRDKAGMVVHSAGSTAEAEALPDIVPGLAPDVILADYHLAGGDTGLAAIAALRARLGEVPALMVTAHAAPEVARACAALEVPLLLKPVAPAELRRAIDAAISAQR